MEAADRIPIEMKGPVGTMDDLLGANPFCLPAARDDFTLPARFPAKARFLRRNPKSNENNQGQP